MKKAIWLFGILMLSAILFGGNSEGGVRPQEQKKEQKSGLDSDRQLALKFLQGIQDGDKNKMYEATNLTEEIVKESREKLVYAELTEQQRKEDEYALRTSGQIDFFIAKIRRMFPKSSRIQILKTLDKGTTDDVGKSDHLVKITYLKKEEAMHDKTGRPVKEMVVHVQQLTRSVSGRSIHEFSFNSRDFEKIADKDFEVLSYF